MTDTINNGKILVIKLGALGDFVQALGPMKAIRKAHPEADITLMTTDPFSSLGILSGYCDHVWIDTRPKFWHLNTWMQLRHKLNTGEFKRVYDLQNNDRTNTYFKLFKSKNCPEWVGAAKGASHQNESEQRTAGLAFDGHKQTLALAGVDDVKVDDLSWVENDVSHFELEQPYLLIAPGSSPQHPEKRWPIKEYAILAQRLRDWGFTPVIVGTKQESELGEEIKKLCPDAINLCGQTAILDLAVLARNASAAIGNDSGPMHIVGQTGCPTCVLFSEHSNPSRHRPIGDFIHTIQRDDLSELKPHEVLEQFKMRDFRFLPQQDTGHIEFSE